MRLFGGILLIIAFFAWFLYQWYATKSLAIALKNSAPAFFFIGIWIVIIYAFRHI